jgi:hypothetical protein
MARASRFPAKWSNNCRDGKNGPIGIIRSSSFWLRFDASAESADCCDRWCVDFAESVLIPLVLLRFLALHVVADQPVDGDCLAPLLA